MRAEPRWATPRTPDRPTIGPAIAAIAAELGVPLLPWQRHVADVGGELVADDRTGLLIPAFRTVAFTVPRQSGKTTLILAWLVQRCVGWTDDWGPQKCLYSAQNGNAATRKIVDDFGPFLMKKAKRLGVFRVRRGIGNIGVDFVNGSMIGVLASSDNAGHGMTVDLAIKDELFADFDDRRDQALIPAMATRRAGQVIACSTMGTDESVPLLRLVDAGRAAAERGQRDGIAFFEWSAPSGADIDDRRVWAECMPALGATIDESVVAHARATMTEAEFRRAFLNQPTVSDERAIPQAVWEQVTDETVTPSGRLCCGVDVAVDRSAAAVVMVDDSGRAELVDHRPGTGWVTGRLVELWERWRAPVAVDRSGPAGTVADELDRAGVPMVVVSGGDLARACASLHDRLRAGTVCVRSHPALDAAVSAARRRDTASGWTWSRRHGADLSPLYALTVAMWAHRTVHDHADLFVY